MNRFRRAIAFTLKSGEIDAAVIRDAGRAIEAAHDADTARLFQKVLIRHRYRPGPKRDPERDECLADAVIWARFNRNVLSREEAISVAAERYGLPRNVVERAYQGKNEKITALIRRRQPSTK